MKIFKAESNTLKEFRAFALKANAMDLAVAVALGAAFNGVVNSIVKDMFTPIIGVIFKADFSTLSFTIHGSVFTYGSVINALISFVVVAAALFFLVVKPMNALRKRFGLDGDPGPGSHPCPACKSAINVEARRCPNCTEVLGENWATTA